jgi:hypothetical protein
MILNSTKPWKQSKNLIQFRSLNLENSRPCTRFKKNDDEEEKRKGELARTEEPLPWMRHHLFASPLIN